jgi:hypothetical protein
MGAKFDEKVKQDLRTWYRFLDTCTREEREEYKNYVRQVRQSFKDAHPDIELSEIAAIHVVMRTVQFLDRIAQ